MVRTTFLLIMLAIHASLAFGQCPTPGPANWCSGTYQYDAAGNIKTIGADTYVYDELGRLVNGTADVQRTGVMSRQYYDYDPFGNRTTVSRQSGSVDCLGGCELSPALTVSTATNHVSNHNALYDEAGNLTRIDSATYSYDGAGMLARATTIDDRQYIYTADDERIATRNGLSWTWTVRGLDQKVLREFTSYEVSGLPTSNRQWAKDYVWRDGSLLASVAPGNVVQHYHLDHLGTPRVVSSGAGMRTGDHAYYPFGAELTLTPHESPPELMKFTGHERDVLGNDPHTLDMMHARYEMATLGRFLSVDPARHSPQTSAPQSWNRYSYARNNPVRNIDRDGKVTFDTIDTKRAYELARAYVSRSPLGANLMERFDRLKGAKEPNLMLSSGSSFYSDRTNTISWNLQEGLHLASWGNGRPSSSGSTIMSPAMALVHEIAHAVRQNEAPQEATRDVATNASTAGAPNKEEERATRVETAIATQLGEAARVEYYHADPFYFRTTFEETIKRLFADRQNR